MKKYRRKGVGRAAAMKIFDMFPGGWEIALEAYMGFINQGLSIYFKKQNEPGAMIDCGVQDE